MKTKENGCNPYEGPNSAVGDKVGPSATLTPQPVLLPEEVVTSNSVTQN